MKKSTITWTSAHKAATAVIAVCTAGALCAVGIGTAAVIDGGTWRCA